jgi:hypothetical protein
MVVYATADDLADFLDPAPVPPTAPRHLPQASEDIDELLIGAVYDVDANDLPTDPRIADALKRATCAQALFIAVGGDETGAKAQFGTVNVGSIAYSRNQRMDGANARVPLRYGPRAVSILRMAQLLPISARSH